MLFLLAVSMCLVFGLLLFCVLVPVWTRQLQGRQVARRLQGMEGLVEGLIGPEDRPAAADG